MVEEGGPDDFWEARASLILHLRQLGITDPELLRAFESVPHHVFVPDNYAEYAYRDSSLPIACGQSITSPTILAGMLVPLAPQGAGKVLEIGTGSGYSTALLSRLAKRVFTVERFRQLASEAQARWQSLTYNNIVGLYDDGLFGLTQQAPFDRIFLAGSVRDVPFDLTDQLADGGVAVMAVGAPDEKQVILRVERVDDTFLDSEHGTVRLAPLTAGRARPQ